MKKVSFLLLLLAVPFLNADALTTLSPGQIVIVRANSDSSYPGGANSNGFDFVTTVDLDAGTQIYFADKGWDGSFGVPFWRATTGEGLVRYTAPAGGLTKGTIVSYDDTMVPTLPSSGSGVWDMYNINSTTGALTLSTSISSGFDAANSGDNILVFQDPTNTNSAATPSFIYGIGWAVTTSWISSGTPSTNNSWIPAGISAGTNTVITLGNIDNFRYSCTVLGMHASNFLSSLNTPGNWVSDDVTAYGPSSCSFDGTRPSVTVNQAPAQNDPTNTNPINFRVVFSEAINPVTFTAGDITLSGSASATVGTPTTSDNITWTIPVTASSNGTIIATLSASVITDANGNPNTTSTSTDNTVTYDATAPTISEVTAVTTPTNDSTPSYTFTTNEPGTITYGGSCASATTTATSGSNTVVFNTLADGTYTDCTITVTDAAGNISNTITVSSFTIDTTNPVIIINNPSILPAISKTITASTNEGTLFMSINAPGVNTCDNTLTFVAYSSTIFSSESDNNRTVCYRAVDSAGNTTYTVSSSIVGIDTTGPSITLSSTSPATVSGTFSVTASVVEAVSEFTLSDIVVTNGTASNLVGSGSGPYTFDVTPTLDGALSITIPAGALPMGIVDALLNRQTISSNTLNRTVALPVLPPAPVFNNSAAVLILPQLSQNNTQVNQNNITDTSVCLPYLTNDIKLGAFNNKDEVNKLITYLNTYEGENLSLDGSYDPNDYDAVVRFQTKYFDQIIKPWGGKSATGIVSKFTRGFINVRSCARKTTCPYFTNYHKLGTTGGDVNKIQNFINLLMGKNLNETNYSLNLANAVAEYQTLYKDTVLTPIGLSKATGYWAKMSTQTGNKIVGCN
jgi:hypothetical protein